MDNQLVSCAMRGEQYSLLVQLSGIQSLLHQDANCKHKVCLPIYHCTCQFCWSAHRLSCGHQAGGGLAKLVMTIPSFVPDQA